MPDERSASLPDLEDRWSLTTAPQAGLRLAEELHRLGEDPRAERILDEVEEGLATEPRNLSARVALGGLRLAMGRANDAARALEAVVERDPTHLKANKLLVETYMELGERARARDRLDLYRLLNEGDSEIEALEGLVVGVEPAPAETPRRATGAPRLLRLPEEEPFAALSFGPTASVPAGDDVFDPVAAPPVPVAAPLPDPAETTATLADLYREQGHHQEAENLYREVLERSPDNLQARQGLEELAAQAPPAASWTERPPGADEPLASEQIIEPEQIIEADAADSAQAEPQAAEPEAAEPELAEPESAPPSVLGLGLIGLVEPTTSTEDATPGDARQRRIAAVRGYLELIQKARGAAER